MKRAVLHGIFWFVYLIQDTILHYTWMASALATVPETVQFGMAVKTAFVLLPPKLLIVYYLIFFAVKNLLDDRQNRIRTIIETLVLLFLSVVLFRILFHYIVYPAIYQLPVKLHLFNVRNFLISILEMGYITGIAFAFKLLRIQYVAKINEQKLIREKLSTELKFLRNQTNPHFLFNTLNNIYALTRKKSDQAPEAVMKLSELLSFMLYETKKDTISIADEIKMVEDYLALERLRYSERLSLRFDKDIDDVSQAIAPLLLLPLVENAFKHGVSETRFDSAVIISLTLLKGHLNVLIENSVENASDRKQNGNIGLESTRRQLELMYRDFDLRVEKNQNLFRVNMRINLNSYGKI